MITKFKIFENINEPQIGDYVVCKESDLFGNIDIITSNRVGQLVYIDTESTATTALHIIKYDLSKQERENFRSFLVTELGKSGIDDDMQTIKSCRRMMRSEIKFWSNNKEDCQMYLNSKKFNV